MTHNPYRGPWQGGNPYANAYVRSVSQSSPYGASGAPMTRSLASQGQGGNAYYNRSLGGNGGYPYGGPYGSPVQGSRPGGFGGGLLGGGGRPGGRPGGLLAALGLGGGAGGRTQLDPEQVRKFMSDGISRLNSFMNGVDRVSKTVQQMSPLISMLQGFAGAKGATAAAATVSADTDGSEVELDAAPAKKPSRSKTTAASKRRRRRK